MDKKRLGQLLMIPLTALLVLLLLTQVSPGDIVDALSSVSYVYLASAFFLYVLVYVIRALRFALMLNTRDVDGIFKIVCVHSFANNVMPFRSGELTFMYLAKLRMGVSLGIGATVIAIARLYDVLVICIMFTASLLIAPEDYGYFSGYVPAIVVFMVALALLISATVWLNRYFAVFTRRLFSWGPLSRAGFLQPKVEQICGYCSSIGPITVPMLLLTTAMWALQALNLYLLAAGMGMGLGFWTTIVGMLLAIVFVSLPIQGVGNFGSFELAWSAIFVALGAPVSAAVSSGFAVHLIVLAFTTFLWLYGMAAERLLSGKKDIEIEKSH